MKPASRKEKGRRLQVAVVEDILRTFAALSADDVRSTPSGCSGEDVQLSPRARALVPFSIEAKNTEKLNIWSAIDQADCRAHEMMIIFKRNRSKTYAIVEWDTMLRLLKGRAEADISVRLELMKSARDILTQAIESTERVTHDDDACDHTQHTRIPREFPSI